MATRSAVLTVQILTDASKAAPGLQQATSSYQKFQAGVDKLVPAAAIATAAIVGIGTKAVNSASRTEQAMGALDSVFGTSAGVVKGWAAQASTSVGLAESEYAEMASVIGAQLGNMGLSMEESLAGTQNLISMGADLAATFGGSTADAVNALTAALRGEADPAERYGLSLKVTDVNARLAAKGLSGLEGDALKTAKTQELLAMAAEQSGGAIGQFGRESDTVAGQTQRMNAQIENALSDLGTALLPVVAAVAGALADMATWVGENSTLVLILGGVVGALAAAILLISGAMKAWTAIQTASTAAQWLWNAAMNANPIGIIIVLIAGLVAAFVLLWNNSEGFRNFFIGMWEGIKTAIAAVVDWFGAAWGAVTSWFQSVWEGVSNFFSDLWARIRLIIAVVVIWFQQQWQKVTTFFQTIVNGWKAVFTTVFNAVKTVITTVANFFRTAWQTAVNVVTTIIRTVQTVISTVFNVIRTVVSSVTNFFKSVWTTAVNAVKSVMNTLRSVFTTVMNVVLAPVRAVQNAFNAVVGAIKNVINWLGRIKIPDVLGSIGNVIGGIFGRSAAVPPGAQTMAAAAFSGAYQPGVTAAATVRRAPKVRAVAPRTASGGGGTVNITINGAMDPDATARKVQQLLTGRDRRTGGVVLKRRSIG